MLALTRRDRVSADRFRVTRDEPSQIVSRGNEDNKAVMR